MALLKAFTTPQGIPCPQAYHRIVNVRSHKDDQGNFIARCSVSTYFSQQARVDDKPPVATRGWQFPYDINVADNIFVQGYTHLKTLADFNGATDV